MPALTHMPLYLCYVTKTGLGPTGRNILAASNMIPAGTDEIPPLLDGLFKLPPPKKDDIVLIFSIDRGHTIRFYLPVRAEFPTVSNDGAKIQMESEAEVELQGTEVKVGANATEPMILGDTLISILGTILDTMATSTHTGNMGAPTSPPLEAALYTTLKQQLESAKAHIGKVE